MKRTFVLATLMAALSVPAVAGATGQPKTGYGKHAPTGVTIVASCFRGPWEDVIWDRPNPAFIDSLVAAGYDYPTAHSIGERVCRDASLVGNPDRMRDETRRVLRATPKH